MPKRKRRKQNKGMRFARGLGVVLLLLVLGFAAALISCTRVGEPTSGGSALAHRHVRPVRHAPSGSDRAEAQARRAPAAHSPAPVTVPAVPWAPDEAQSGHPRQAADLENECRRGNPDSRRIALTFDAGASSKPASDILDALAKRDVHATFFLTGRWIEQNPSLTRRICEEGHEIGNHTYSHRRLTRLDANEIAEEAEKTEQLVVKLTGRSTKPLLRVPFGDRDARVLSTLADLGYRSIYWDVDSWDAHKPNMTSSEISQRVTGRVRNGSIILMHVGSRATADALDSLLQDLTAAGYEPVTVSELLR